MDESGLNLRPQTITFITIVTTIIVMLLPHDISGSYAIPSGAAVASAPVASYNSLFPVAGSALSAEAAEASSATTSPGAAGPLNQKKLVIKRAQVHAVRVNVYTSNTPCFHFSSLVSELII